MSVQPVSSTPSSAFDRSAALLLAWAMAGEPDPLSSPMRNGPSPTPPMEGRRATDLLPAPAPPEPSAQAVKVAAPATPASTLATSAQGTARGLPLSPASLLDVADSGAETQQGAPAAASEAVYERELRPRRFRFGLARVAGTNADLASSTKLPPLVEQASPVADPVAVETGPLQRVDATTRKALDAAHAIAARQGIRRLDSGLLIDATRHKTSIADLQALRGARQDLVGMLERKSATGESLARVQCLLAHAELQATCESLDREQGRLDGTLDRLRRFTGNPGIEEKRIPRLRNHDATPPALLVTSSSFLSRLQPSDLRAALDANPHCVASSVALGLARERLEAVEAAARTNSVPREIVARGIADFVFDKDILALLRTPPAAGAEEAVRADERPAADAPPTVGPGSEPPEPERSRIESQLQATRLLLDAKDGDRIRHREHLYKQLESRLQDLTSQGPGSFWNRSEVLKASVNVAARRCLEASAACEADPHAGPEAACRARIEHLEKRKGYNETAGDFLSAMNLVVYMMGGFGDTGSGIFQAFDAAFISSYG